MLCEYLRIPYRNEFFNPYSWKKFKEENTGDWLFEDLPFMKDGDLVITQIYPMCEYLIRKAQRDDLLGKTLQDQLVVDKFTWNKDLIQTILSLVVENKNNPSRLMQELECQWEKSIKGILLKYEEEAQPDSFYLGYLTIIDFMVHEIFQYYKDIFHKKVHLFPKLIALRQRVAAIPEVA